MTTSCPGLQTPVAPQRVCVRRRERLISLTWTSLLCPALLKVTHRCDVPDVHQHQRRSSLSLAPPSPVGLPPPSPPPDDPVLEWDPSVDVGRSVCQEDGDSSYFSASAGKTFTRSEQRGVTGRDSGCAGAKRRSYLSSLSDISRHDHDAEWVSPLPVSAQGR